MAIAGLHAAGSGRPRAVVLAVGDKEPDASLFGIEATKQFLRAINRLAATATSQGWDKNVFQNTALRQ